MKKQEVSVSTSLWTFCGRASYPSNETNGCPFVGWHPDINKSSEAFEIRHRESCMAPRFTIIILTPLRLRMVRLYSLLQPLNVLRDPPGLVLALKIRKARELMLFLIHQRII